MPIAYIPRTRERYAAYPPYRWVVNTEAPWTPLPRPLRECRLGLISSGGFYHQGQTPLDDSDVSYRLFPMDTPLNELRIHHHGYRDDDADRDPNCVLPLERLQEFVRAGVLGGLASHVVSFVMTYAARRDINERGPAIAAELRKMEVDAVLAVPV